MREKHFLISFIEDNKLGVYVKELLVTSNNIKSCTAEWYEKNPTLLSVREVKEKITEEMISLYSHEGQDQLRYDERERLKNR